MSIVWIMQITIQEKLHPSPPGDLDLSHTPRNPPRQVREIVG